MYILDVWANHQHGRQAVLRRKSRDNIQEVVFIGESISISYRTAMSFDRRVHGVTSTSTQAMIPSDGQLKLSSVQEVLLQFALLFYKGGMTFAH
jgi:hypothetical protein